MSRPTQNVTPASQIGGANGYDGVIDAFALSDNARIRRMVVTPGALTQNSTVTAYKGPFGQPGIILAAYASAHTVPIAAGGTLALNIRAGVAGAFTTIATLDPQTLSADVGLAFTMQAFNDTYVAAAVDTLAIDAVASNNAIGTAAVGLEVVILFLPIEPLVAGSANPVRNAASLRTGTAVG